MTARARAILLLLVGALVVVPVGVLHPIVVHVDTEGAMEFSRGLDSPGFLALLALAVAGILPLAGSFASLPKARRANRTAAQLRAGAEIRSHAGVTYLRVPADEFGLLTMGFWRPTIVVTAGAEDLLSANELRAALLHERAHQQRRDVLWRALLVAATNLFGVLPWVRALVADGVLRSECLADDDALVAGANRKALFEALVIAAAAVPQAGAANLSDGSVEYRLFRIARRDPTLPRCPTGGLSALALALISLPILAHAILLVGLACSS